jgi:hypothetical protein
MNATARGYADSLADRARAVRLEDEIARRGIELKWQGKELIGACPRCGGDDRFWGANDPGENNRKGRAGTVSLE